jgi:hypothetical protein
VYVWHAATCIYTHLHVRISSRRVPLLCVWIIAIYSYTLLHVRISSLRLPLVYVFFLHAFSSSGVCFLASLFSPDIDIAVSHPSSSHWNSLRILCFTFVATRPPFQSEARRRTPAVSSTCCVVRSDEFSLHEFFFSDTVSFLIPRTT